MKLAIIPSISKTDSNTLQAVWVGLGSIISFSFTLVSTAVLSRFLSKGDYGTYKQVMYVYNTLLMVFTLGLPKAYSYFLPISPLQEGKSIINKISGIFMALGFLFSSLLFLGAPAFAALLNNPDLVLPLRVFSPSPLFLLPTMGLEGIMSVHRKSHINTVYLLVTRLLMLLFVLCPVILFRQDCVTALMGFSASTILSCCLALWCKSIPYMDIKSVKARLSYKEIFDFSIPLLFASIGGVVIRAADQFYVSRFFGKEVFADFSNGSLELPFVGMVISASATVLLPVFSRNLKETDSIPTIVGLWRRSIEKAAMILYPLVVYCWFYAEEIMVFLYGSQYIGSAAFFKIMLVVNIFTIAPYYPIIIALGETRYYAKVHMWMALSVWSLEYVSILLFQSPFAITIVSVICSIVKICIMASFIARSLGVPLFRLIPFHPLSRVFFLSLMAIAPSVVLVRFVLVSNTMFFCLVISFACYLLTLYLLGLLFKIDFISIIRPLLKQKA